MTKRLTRIMSVWCDQKPPFCSTCIGPECPHAWLEFDYDNVKEIKDERPNTNYL